MIVRKGNKFCLVAKSTRRNLGCFPTKAQAQRRERQVQFFKRRGR